MAALAGRHAELEHHARDLAGQVIQHAAALGQFVGEPLDLGDVGGGADHAQRIALGIARHHLAAATDPLVAAVAAADAVLHLVGVGARGEMLAHGLLYIGQVIRMDALVGVFQVAGELPVLVAEDGLPAARIIHLAGDGIAVPDAGAAAFDGQRHALIGFPGGSQLMRAWPAPAARSMASMAIETAAPTVSR
jgi:hypothetical protein